MLANENTTASITPVVTFFQKCTISQTKKKKKCSTLGKPSIIG